ncbi:MAG: hypothetical protein NTX22_10495 [Ignavibacteriales bacterium]|nr:hypothetical protein [Ignavibacteriales bacterium]
MLIPYNAPNNFDWIVKLKDWKLNGNALILSCITANGWEASILFRAASKDVWNYTFIPPNAKIVIPSQFVNEDYIKPISLTVIDNGDGIEVTGTSLRLSVCRDPFSIHFFDVTGKEVFGENNKDVDGLGRKFVLPLGYAKENDEVVVITQSFNLNQDEAIFGLGEKFTPLNKVGQKITSWTVDALGSTSERSYKNIPFLWSTIGYGLLINSGARITWEIGTESCQSYTIKQEANTLDVFVIYGPNPKEILKRYSDITGYAPVPPKWSFGLWISSGGTYRDQEAMEKLVSGLEDYNIPADVVHIDPWWMKWREYCNFKWNREAFPQIENFIEGLHRKGLKVCLWEHPYISIESDLYREGITNNYFIKHSNGKVYVIDYGLSLVPLPDGIVRTASSENSWNARVVIIDLTNPDAYDWFKNLHRPIFKDGADVFKTDFGEDIPEDAIFFNGETGKTMHNLYPLLYNKAVFEVTKEEKKYGIVWSRSGTAGNQRYPTCWSGDPAADFESLACTIRGGLSIGLSGVPFWSNDIGGYRGMPSPELYIRWAQFGLFCSHSRMHGDSPREPWYFGEIALAYVRKYINLRYQLFPYIYSTAIEASRTGMPVMRALPLIFPDDPNTFNKDLEYMFGPSLLIAPIYDGSNSRIVYFPKGEWIDYHSGVVYKGTANVRVEMPMEDMPIFVKRGSTIPMMQPANRIPESFIDPLIIEIYPDNESKYILYEDEGETEFICKRSDANMVVEIKSGNERNYFLRFRHTVSFTKAKLMSGKESEEILAEVTAENICQFYLPKLSNGKIIITR